MWDELRYAVRLLRQSPGFTSVAVVTLALGIGANTVIFLLVNAVLLRPLPFRDQDRLIVIDATQNGPPIREAMSFPDVIDFRTRSHSFDAIETYSAFSGVATGIKEPEQVRGLQISPTLLPFLGQPLMLGRNFLTGRVSWFEVTRF